MAGEYVLVVDDEKEIGDLLSMYLKREGFKFAVAHSGKEAIEKVKETRPDLVVLDVFLPDIDGHEVCRTLRTFTDSPILFLSCKDTEMDKIIGLSIGADDYISKPFSANELMARIKAHLRRQQKLHRVELEKEQKDTTEIVSASLQLDTARHEAFLHGKKIGLSAKEFQLLAFFMLHPHQVFSTDHILEQLWGFDFDSDTKTVKVHIGKLRKKIEDDPGNPKKIITIRGVGYRFDDA
ncbi:response regulator transcription factor [Ammoniphilus sp. 3BR4]|uniref:response regulator transcription factor n=1 Tax=Ammoniphilus sp. 3BR4 TaxID=3158265 RepID=UPI003466222E